MAGLSNLWLLLPGIPGLTFIVWMMVIRGGETDG